MSLLLYNPLEALIIIMPLWIRNLTNLNYTNKAKLVKTLIKDCYTLGTIFLVIQLPLNFITETILYTIYDLFICLGLMIIVLFVYNKLRFKNNNLFICALIQICYYTSLTLIISNSNLYLQFINGINPFVNELLINLYVRSVQIIFILLYLGGHIMFKKNLIKTAKANLGKTVASTVRLVGEPKLSKTLKEEVKKSK